MPRRMLPWMSSRAAGAEACAHGCSASHGPAHGIPTQAACPHPVGPSPALKAGTAMHPFPFQPSESATAGAAQAQNALHG
eukprot:1152346-Pelagomonas_calceolata.AAC.9